ncbi:MAG: nucleotidyltransferase domain-containing protein [Bacteroidia bacterium]|nr:nucleotidyltransferase domain-containing protein [Bacteroidia bacterium]
MSNASNILNYLSVNKQRLLDEYHLTQIALFGSLARGEDTAKSDIDLLVEFKPETKDLYDLKRRLKTEIESVFNREVDICRIKYLKPFMKSRILSDVKYV